MTIGKLCNREVNNGCSSKISLEWKIISCFKFSLVKEISYPFMSLVENRKRRDLFFGSASLISPKCPPGTGKEARGSVDTGKSERKLLQLPERW
jgi:hypothetical protein